MKIDIDKYMIEKEYYQLGQEDEREIIKMKVGFLRQFLNERQPGPLTNEDILYWLGMATAEEVNESHKRDVEIMERSL